MRAVDSPDFTNMPIATNDQFAISLGIDNATNCIAEPDAINLHIVEMHVEHVFDSNNERAEGMKVEFAE
jgi:hypothetical protein